MGASTSSASPAIAGHPSSRAASPLWLFAPAIFLSAFLLFLVQPLIARIILPWFGGGASVWTTCLMFFQVVLLAGYSYSYATVRWLRPKTQATLHLALLAASLLALPILPGVNWKPSGSSHPVWHILLLLAATAGFPYLLLSTTGPLLQAWYAGLRRAHLPYRLYALSNAGSLLALIGFPLLLEPALGSRAQAYLWSAAYAFFAVLCGAVAWRFYRGASPVAMSAEPLASAEARPPAKEQLLWVGLAAAPSALLLAVTNHISQNIAPVPLLWVIPLGLYLLSLVLCFESDRWYRRAFWLKLWLVAVGGMTYVLFPEEANTNVKVLLPVFMFGFFCCAMACHGELALRRPAPRWLTLFYLQVSAGGAVGGLFVAIVAPVIFRSYLELPVALLAAVILVTLAAWRGGYIKLSAIDGPSILFAAAAVAVALGYRLTAVERNWLREHRLVERTFYGVSLVEDDDDEEPEIRSLLHGTINHGAEYVAPLRRHEPISYYAPQSGVGLAIAGRQLAGPVRLGFIGLGAGTLAAYGRPADTIRFYEINPLVERIARTQFWYLRDCPSRLDVVIGDARRSLESEPPQHFDVLAVDAFSSDAIPVHLLTVEAFREYFRHLKPEGILAVHISNRYLRLEGVVRAGAAALGKRAILISYWKPKNDEALSNSDWVLVSSEPAVFDAPPLKMAQTYSTESRPVRVWTDDYSNLLSILK